MVGLRNLRNESLNSDGKIRYILEFTLYTEPKLINMGDFAFEVDDNNCILVDSIYFGEDSFNIGRADNFSYIDDSIYSSKYRYADNKLLIDEDAQPMRYYRRKVEEILKGLTPTQIRVWKVRRGRPQLVDEIEIDYSEDDRYSGTLYVDALGMQFLYRRKDY